MLSPAELSLYDRQIRLWGLGKQRLLRASVIGVVAPYAVLGAAQEMLKNIALKGVGKVILCSKDRLQKDAVLFGSCDFLKEIHELNPAVEWEVVGSVGDCLDHKPNILCVFSSSIQECFDLNADCIARGILFQLVVPINSSYCIMCSFTESLEDFCISYKERFTNGGAGGRKGLHGEFGNYLANGFSSIIENSLKTSLFTTALNAIVGAVSAQEIFTSVTTVVPNDSDDNKNLDQRPTKAYFICAESLESSIIS